MAVKVNCLNPIAACGMELLPDTYEITDNYADAGCTCKKCQAA